MEHNTRNLLEWTWVTGWKSKSVAFPSKQKSSCPKSQVDHLQPNFFVQMQPGVLEAAPKTFIGTLNDLEPAKRRSFRPAGAKFPTISILDVERTGRKILNCFANDWTLQVMAALSILAGLIVLYSQP